MYFTDGNYVRCLFCEITEKKKRNSLQTIVVGEQILQHNIYDYTIKLTKRLCFWIWDTKINVCFCYISCVFVILCVWLTFAYNIMFWTKKSKIMQESIINNTCIDYGIHICIHIRTSLIYICFALDLNDTISLDETCYVIAVCMNLFIDIKSQIMWKKESLVVFDGIWFSFIWLKDR